ncbi:hypothetical protein ACF1BP_36315 [Streptomyces sp. NPDC014735]|uniref:hypothetical protein n=1 Tax=unclassified Streptomyces TaxID=2593676 RepID=UPI0036FA030B
MSDVGLSLGPLERVNDRWVVGDSRRPGGTWLEFRSGGLYQHEPNSEGKLIPWQRITLVTQFTLGAKYPKYSYSPMALLGGLPGPWKGRGPGYLHMTLRHPYENEVVRFDRHPHWYNPTELVLFQTLLAQTADAGEAHRFGDADWMDRAVEQLVRQRPSTARGVEQAVTEARQA